MLELVDTAFLSIPENSLTKMEKRLNTRKVAERYKTGQHLNIEELKENCRHLDNRYLDKDNIPDYPRPEFHVSHLKHDTASSGLEGIIRDGGFRGNDSLLWWSLAVKPEDITAAEARFLEKTFPDRTEEQVKNQESFLGRFATSPAFSEKSRMGSYRFTLSLEQILEAYSQQVQTSPDFRIAPPTVCPAIISFLSPVLRRGSAGPAGVRNRPV